MQHQRGGRHPRTDDLCDRGDLSVGDGDHHEIRAIGCRRDRPWSGTETRRRGDDRRRIH
jgi:hypothetical protein